MFNSRQSRRRPKRQRLSRHRVSNDLQHADKEGGMGDDSVAESEGEDEDSSIVGETRDNSHDVNVDDEGRGDGEGRGDDEGIDNESNNPSDMSMDSATADDDSDYEYGYDVECPSLGPRYDSDSSDDEDEDGDDFSVNEESRSADVNLRREIGYNADGSKNDNYHYWRGTYYDEQSGKFKYDTEDNSRIHETPKPSEWKKVPPGKMKAIEVSFNKGRETLMHHYVEEHDAFLKRLEELDIPPNKDGIFNHVFGDESRFAGSMKRTLEMDYEVYCRFIATVYFTAEFNQTAKRLQKDGRVSYEGYLPASSFSEIWRKVSVVGKDGSVDKLWEELEVSLNKDCRELFLSGKSRPEQMRIALDDDKVHFHFSTEVLRNDREFLMGIKSCQHVKANCRGFTIDSAVSSATGFPLHFAVERSGDSNTDNYKRMIKFMFHHAFTNGGAIHEALRGITFCSDRGYWNPVLILLLLGYAATIFGTWKRAYWNVFTFNQSRQLNGRVVIDTRFGRSVYNAFCVWRDTMLKAVAWRSGTGKVSIAATSDVSAENSNEVQCIDFSFKSGADAKWYKSTSSQSDLDLKAFPAISGVVEPGNDNILKSIYDHLTMLPVKMLTVSDLDAIWFELRKFAWTSLSVDCTIRAVAPLIDADDPIYADLQIVLGYSGMKLYLKSDTSSNSAVDEDNPSNESNSDLMSGGKVKEIIHQLNATAITEQSLNQCVDIVSQMNAACSTTDSTNLTNMLMALGHDRVRADIEQSKQIALFKKWSKSVKSTATNIKVISPPTESATEEQQYQYTFPYDILNDKDIQTLLRKRVGLRAINSGAVPGPHSKPSKKVQRVESLQYLDKHLDEWTQEVDAADDGLLDISYQVITGIIKRAFLKPHKDTADKSATRFGHQNEKPYVKQFLEDSMNNLVPNLNLCHVRNCGLAMHVDREYVRDSADVLAFECVETEDDYIILSHPVECKCRSGGGYLGSVKKAISIQKKIADLAGCEAQMRIVSGKRGAVYASVNSSEVDKLKRLIPDSHELIQLLHHAFCYGKEQATLLVGKSNGSLLYGITVYFEDDLLDSYGRLLEHLYHKGLSLFYEEDFKKLPVKFIEEVMQSDDTLKRKYDLDDFFTSLLTFRALIPSKSDVNFPIPPCEKGVPFEHSLWNGSKGGSDTVTRYTYNCQAVLPVRSPQTVIVTREIMLYSVIFHRCCQAVTMRKQPDIAKDTIKSIRDRNNKRIAFRDSLQYICKMLLLNASKAKANKIAPQNKEASDTPNTRPLVAQAPRMTESNKNVRCEVDHRIMSVGGKTGGTPNGRGKPLQPKNSSAEFEEFKRKLLVCPGRPIKVGRMKTSKDKDDMIVLNRRVCLLCKKEGIPFECSLCHAALCFDTDRTQRLLDAMKGERAEEIKELAPDLKELPRNDKPPLWCQAGETEEGSGKFKYVQKSCFHWCHKNYLVNAAPNTSNDGETNNSEDYQLNSISRNMAFTNSPSANN